MAYRTSQASLSKSADIGRKPGIRRHTFANSGFPFTWDGKSEVAARSPANAGLPARLGAFARAE
jgi:hypothetical protein